ncbi:MAG: zinc metallopeptidase, partial [Fibrobacteres bacterium]|nr:zinc metallopeptidase [Fibrobacterota bacterium]
MFYFDPMYFLFAAPGLLLALYATYKTRSTFSKYSEAFSKKGYTGAQAAARLLSSAGVRDVKIEETSGTLS